MGMNHLKIQIYCKRNGGPVVGCCEHGTECLISMKDRAENSWCSSQNQKTGVSVVASSWNGAGERCVLLYRCVQERNSLVAGGQPSTAVSLTVRGETNMTSRKWGTEYG